MMDCKRFLLSLFCCSSCPGIPTSVTPKIIVIIFLYAIFAIEFLILSDVLPISLELITFCREENEYLYQDFLRILIIYRISLAIYIFLAFMVIVTHGIKSSRDGRTPAHNACWFLKFFSLAALSLACLQIPPGRFDSLFVYFGALHSVTFSVFEFATLLKVAYKCSCHLLRKGKIANYIPLVFAEGTMIASPFIYLALLFREALLTVDNTVLFSKVIVTVSLPYVLLFGHLIAVCVRGWKCTMLNGGLLCCQVVYFTSLAMFHFPNHEKLDNINEKFFDIENYFGVAVALMSVILFSVIDVYKPIAVANAVVYVEGRGNEIVKVWGKIRLVRAILPPPPQVTQNSEVPKPPSFRNEENNRFVSCLKNWGANCLLCPFLNYICAEDRRPSQFYHQYVFVSVNENDDEYNRVKYKWRDFYIICNHLTMYIMMCSTKWIYPYLENGELLFENRNAVAMWANFISCWCCCIAFMVFIFLPKYYQ